MLINLPEGKPTGSKKDNCIPGCKYLVNGKCQCIGFCALNEADSDGDCFSCGHSGVTEDNELFCVVKQEIVEEDGYCKDFN